MPLLYTIGKLTVGNLLMVGWRPHVEGLENVPKTGGAIFAGNHLSVADELFIGAVVPRHLAFWAKSDYFDGTGVSGWFTRNLLNGLGAIRVQRAGGRDALAAFSWSACSRAMPGSHIRLCGLIFPAFRAPS